MGRHLRHPEARAAEVRDKTRADAAASLPLGWRADYGWLLRVDTRAGFRHYRKLPIGTTYAEACQIRDAELKDPDVEAVWLFQRGFHSSMKHRKPKPVDSDL